MTEPVCTSLQDNLLELERSAPDAPLLALGQTIFWDEPMKAGVALAARRLGLKRKLVAGVHDTDYLAKLPSGPRQPGRYRALPHNDTTTRGLWSAAAEFSALFGSETVVSRDLLTAGGLRISALQEARPNILDQATEAWGWRGVVSLDDYAPITADVPLKPLLPVLRDTLDWALDTSLDSLVGEGREIAATLADELRAMVCDHSDVPGATLAGLYRDLLPKIYDFCANASVDVETTATTELLRFNRATCGLPRFELLDLFVNAETADLARQAYDEAVLSGAGGQYPLHRFGTGAIPFDAIIPGHGRGTIRIGSRGVVFNTRIPQFLSLRRPLSGVRELAELMEAKFGEGCVVVGKAISLIGMLAREFVFVFHEGASSYVKSSRRFHQLLAERGRPMRMNPILRVRYSAWDAMSVCCSWLRLPEPLRRPFGTDELCGPSLAGRWRRVAEEQQELLAQLGRLRRPIELIRYLDRTLGGSWQSLAEEYEGLHRRLERLQRDLAAIRAQRDDLYAEAKRLRHARAAAEAAKGAHWREKLFEKEPTAQDAAERERLSSEVEKAIHAADAVRTRMRALRKEQNALVQDPEVLKVHERRRSIELEAELRRMRLIREAVIATRGMKSASLRPSAWWLRLVCPDGLWFRETVDTAECYLEPLM